MTYLQSIILGVVEGLTEFLPVSSTGHMILVSHLLNILTSDFLKTFEVAIQFGAILAVVVLYWRSMIKNIEVLKRVIVAFIPTAIVGLVLYKLIKSWLGNPAIVLWSLLIGGVVIIIFEMAHRERGSAVAEITKITYQQAFLIGLCQSVAVIPGVSRSAATILGGLALGLKRKVIVEFSFLLAVPTVLAAAALDLLKSSALTGQEYQIILLGAIAAFVSALIGVKFFLSYIQDHKFTAFGVYRIVLAGIFLIFKI